MVEQHERSWTYQLKYAGQPAGVERLTLKPSGRGARILLEAQVDFPLPKTRQRWESDTDGAGFPRRYVERVEGGGTRVTEIEFSRDEGVVVVSQGKEDLALPYIQDFHDPLSLIFAIPQLGLEAGAMRQLAMVGGRVYVERLPDQVLALSWGEEAVQVFRLRPGLSLVYYAPSGEPLKFTQKVGEHVFEAEISQVEMTESAPEPRPKNHARKRRRRKRHATST